MADVHAKSVCMKGVTVSREVWLQASSLEACLKFSILEPHSPSCGLMYAPTGASQWRLSAFPSTQRVHSSAELNSPGFNGTKIRLYI